MIVFNITCGAGHGFEGWFKDAKAFEAQRKARKVACPVCGDTRATKAPSAARIARSGRGDADGPARDEAAAMRQALTRLYEHVTGTCEDVGPRFAEEARKIHYGEAEERGIYGSATDGEAEALSDEGVPFARLPRPPRTDA